MKEEVKLEDFLLIKKSIKEKGDRQMTEEKYGIGLDVGTGFLVGAGFNNDEIVYKAIRNAFVSIPRKLFNSAMFDKNNISYIETEDFFYIIGDDALDFARIKNSHAQRPLEHGILNPSERSSALILKEMFTFVFQSFIKKERETLVYSIPGNQTDNDLFDTNYHSMSIKSLCSRFRVNAVPLNEAFAVSISELGTDTVTALSFSFGAGLVNTCLTYKGISIFEFSIAKSGDFIDSQAARSIGESIAIMSKIKETELNLSEDEFNMSTEERALLFSYRYVVQNTLENVRKSFIQNKQAKILEEIPIIISGGTSLPKGFLDLFRTELEYVKLPFKVSEVRHAKNPLSSVATGCTLWANSLEQEKQ